MATRKPSDRQPSEQGEPGAAPSGDASLRDSASQIWLAGLGAFAKAQEEGGRVFEALVREGTEIHRRTQAATEEKLSEAAHRIASMATDISSRATGKLSRLELLFEDRVAQALQGLGMPTAPEVRALVERIERLEQTLAAARKTRPSRAPAPAPTAPARSRRAAPRKKT